MFSSKKHGRTHNVHAILRDWVQRAQQAQQDDDAVSTNSSSSRVSFSTTNANAMMDSPSSFSSSNQSITPRSSSGSSSSWQGTGAPPSPLMLGPQSPPYSQWKYQDHHHHGAAAIPNRFLLPQPQQQLPPPPPPGYGNHTLPFGLAIPRPRCGVSTKTATTPTLAPFVKNAHGVFFDRHINSGDIQKLSYDELQLPSNIENLPTGSSTTTTSLFCGQLINSMLEIHRDQFGMALMFTVLHRLNIPLFKSTDAAGKGMFVFATLNEHARAAVVAIESRLLCDGDCAYYATSERGLSAMNSYCNILSSPASARIPGLPINSVTCVLHCTLLQRYKRESPAPAHHEGLVGYSMRTNFKNSKHLFDKLRNKCVQDHQSPSQQSIRCSFKLPQDFTEEEKSLSLQHSKTFQKSFCH